MITINLTKEGIYLKNLRNRFERFCYRNRHKGIPNLMLYVVIANVIVYALSMFDQSYVLYSALCFNRTLILQGQVWRLITFVFTGAFSYGNILYVLLFSICYFSLGRAIENIWGTFRFNLFYLTGIILMDIFCMFIPCQADPYYLNLSLFLSYATLFPNAHFLLFFFIPVKAWIFALLDLALILFGVLTDVFPYNLFPLVALANYFLFFGKDVSNVIPVAWQVNLSRLFRKKPKTSTATTKPPIQFSGSYESATVTVKAPYTHQCTICGRTDLTNPELEFRYCSRCSGYHCYCEEHINNHTHIE